MGNQAATYTNAGTLTGGRINNLLVMNPGGVTFNSAVGVPFTFGLYLGAVNPNGYLTLGNAAAASTTQIIERANGSFTSNPIWNNTNITARSNYYYSPNWVPLTQTTITAGNEIELIGAVRTVSGAFTMNTHNNLQLAYPLTVGTATTGSWTLTRGIVIADATNYITSSAYNTSTSGTAPSMATPPITHGSYVAGPLRREFASSGTASKTFPLGVGTAFNGATPSANVIKTVTLAPGTAASQSPTVSIVGAPSGSVNTPLTSVMGTRGFRVNLNGGADFPATATFTLTGMNYTYGNSDNLIGIQSDLMMAQATSLTGPWSQRSVVSGTGTFVDNTVYTRTNPTAGAAPGPVAPLATLGEYFAWGTAAIAQTYASSTVTQTNISPIPGGIASVDQEIIGIQIVTDGALSPLTATQFKLNTTGTTTAANITNAKVYYTGTSNAFAATNLFGTYSLPSGSFNIDGSRALTSGTNYFWLAYDISGTAAVDSYFDAECTQITVAGNNYVPTVTAPAGNRQVKNIVIIPPANTNTASNKVPFGTYYGYERASQIYTAAEVGITPGNQIKTISYWVNSLSTPGDAPTKIYMKNTSNSTFTAGLYADQVDGATLVYDNTIASTFWVAGAWNTITLANPFSVGATNLQVIVETNANLSGNEGSTAKQFRHGPTVTNSAQTWVADTNPPTIAGTLSNSRPNIMLAWQLPPVGPPEAPSLASPAPNATDKPRAGFNFTWNQGGGGTPAYYQFFLSTVEGEIYTQFAKEITGTSINPVGMPYETGTFSFTYGQRYYWQVIAYSTGGVDEAASEVRWFIIENDPNAPITAFPYTQTFASTTFPPSPWTIPATTPAWMRGTPNAYGVAGDGSARANFYSISSGSFDLISPNLNLGAMGGVLTFDHAYATYATENDQLEIMYSVNGGLDYSSLIVYSGGPTGTLNTGGVTTSAFVPTAVQWATKTINFPLGTNKLKFRAISGYGNDLYVDNIVINTRAIPTHDIAVVALTGLPVSQAIGITYNPTSSVANMGSSLETFDVTLTIGSIYTSTRRVTDLASGNNAPVVFAPFTPAVEGNYTATLTATLAGDANTVDNTIIQAVNVFTSLWVNGANIPVSSYMGSASSWVDGTGNGHIITVAGNTTGAANNQVQDYNVNTNTWTALTTIPALRVLPASVVVGNNLYVIGGSDGTNYTNNVWVYNLLTNTWGTALANLPITLSWHKAVAYGTNYIYVAGGIDLATGGTYQSTVYLYNITTNAWSTASAMPGPKMGGAFATVANKLVYAAGSEGASLTNVVYVGTVSPSDPAVINWITSRATYPGVSTSGSSSSEDIAALSVGLRNMKGATDMRFAEYPNGSMFRFDGATWGTDAIMVTGGSPTTAWTPATPGKTYMYTPATDTWSVLPELNIPVLGHYFSTVKSNATTWKAVVASGYTGTAATSVTQVYTKIMSSGPLPTPVVTVTQTGVNVYLSWPAVTGATGGYRIEKSVTPYGPWGNTVINPTTTWNEPATGMKFYRVIALP